MLFYTIYPFTSLLYLVFVRLGSSLYRFCQATGWTASTSNESKYAKYDACVEFSFDTLSHIPKSHRPIGGPSSSHHPAPTRRLVSFGIFHKCNLQRLPCQLCECHMFWPTSKFDLIILEIETIQRTQALEVQGGLSISNRTCIFLTCDENERCRCDADDHPVGRFVIMLDLRLQASRWYFYFRIGRRSQLRLRSSHLCLVHQSWFDWLFSGQIAPKWYSTIHVVYTIYPSLLLFVRLGSFLGPMQFCLVG